MAGDSRRVRNRWVSARSQAGSPAELAAMVSGVSDPAAPPLDEGFL
jgi:hypothetical protein